MKMLWGIRKGKADWQEEIITTNEKVIPEAKKWAESQGFDRFRIAEYNDGDKPDFVNGINN